MEMDIDIDKAKRTLEHLQAEIEFHGKVLLKGINTHTNDVITDLVQRCERGNFNVDLDKLRIGTVLTHDTMETLYNALIKK